MQCEIKCADHNDYNEGVLVLCDVRKTCSARATSSPVSWKAMLGAIHFFGVGGNYAIIPPLITSLETLPSERGGVEETGLENFVAVSCHSMFKMCTVFVQLVDIVCIEVTDLGSGREAVVTIAVFRV